MTDNIIKFCTFTLCALHMHFSGPFKTAQKSDKRWINQASHASSSQDTGLCLWADVCTRLEYSPSEWLTTSFCILLLACKLSMRDSAVN